MTDISKIQGYTGGYAGPSSGIALHTSAALQQAVTPIPTALQQANRTSVFYTYANGTNNLFSIESIESGQRLNAIFEQDARAPCSSSSCCSLAAHRRELSQQGKCALQCRLRRSRRKRKRSLNILSSNISLNFLTSSLSDEQHQAVRSSSLAKGKREEDL